MKNYTEQEVIQAVEHTGGLISEIARRLNCHWQTAKTYVEQYPQAVEMLKSEKQTLIDAAENVIFQAVKNGDIQAAKFVLMTLGKNRGYTERQEVEHNGDMSITIIRNPVRTIEAVE